MHSCTLLISYETQQSYNIYNGHTHTHHIHIHKHTHGHTLTNRHIYTQPTQHHTHRHIHTHTQPTAPHQCRFLPLSRSGYFTYDRDETVFGIPVYRFVIPKEELLNKTLNPANAKYWMDGPSGVLNLTAVFPLSELEVARVTACGGGGL